MVNAETLQPLRPIHDDETSGRVLVASVPTSIYKTGEAVLKSTSPKRATKEMHALTQLASCPSTIRLLGVCATGFEYDDYDETYERSPSLKCLVLEYASNGDAVQYLERRCYKPSNCRDHMVIDVARNVLEALRACHSKDIVHLDVKPENIFIRADGTAALGDFGLCMRAGDQIPGPYGTLIFISPEIAMCNFPDETVAAHSSMDMWSLGVSCLELLNGKSLVLQLCPDSSDDNTVRLEKSTASWCDLTFGKLKLLFTRCARNGGELKLRLDTFTSISEPAREFIMSLCVLDPRKRPDAESLLRESAWLNQNR